MRYGQIRFRQMSRRALSRMMAGAALGMIAFKKPAEAGEKSPTSPVSTGSVEDHLAIEQLLYRYATSIDNLDAASLAACFAPGAVLQGRGLNFQGDFYSDVITMHRSLAQCTMHLVQNHLSTIHDRSASGVAYCVATYVINNDGELTKREIYIRYRDKMVKQNNVWLFLSRQFEVVFTTEAPIVSFNADLSGRR